MSRAKDSIRPKRQSYLAKEMLAISLDDAKELRRIEKTKQYR